MSVALSRCIAVECNDS